MQKQAPNLPKLLTMVLFALSCFGLALFLWLSFGGPVPLQPKGYRIHVDFPEAVTLSEQADVRISGVNVGKVVALQRQTDRTRATISIDPEYAPIPRDSRATLRFKTLIGETYVTLSPGSGGGPAVPDGGTLPDRNVRGQVQLDEVLRAFDKPTRDALDAWLQEMADSLHGRAQDVSGVLGNLDPTVEQGASLLEILDSQHSAVRRLISDTGKVFAAVGSRAGDVQGLITAGDKLFATTARRNRALSDTIAALPGFMAQTRATLRTAQAAAKDAAPAIRALQPVAGLLKPTLQETSALAPQAKRLFRQTDPVIALSRRGLPAASHLLKQARPLVDVLLPVSEDLVPVARYIHGQQDQVVAAIANVGSILQAALPAPNGGEPIHYLRAIIYFTQEGIVGLKHRLASNRHNAYLQNRGLDNLRNKGVIEANGCQNTKNAQTIPTLDPKVPPCVVQPGFSQFGGGQFPHLVRDSP